MRLTVTIDCADETEISQLARVLSGMTEQKGIAPGPYQPGEMLVEKDCEVPFFTSPPTPPAFMGNEDPVEDAPVPPTPVIAPPPVASVTPPPPPADDPGWPDPPQPEQAATDHLDADDIPWDERIHAGTKTRLKASNTWKLKPGVDKALVEQVKAELKGIQAVPAPPAPTPPADAAAVSAALGGPSKPAPPAPAPTGPTTFAELIKEVTGRITAGQMTPDQVNGAVALVTNGQLTMCNQLAARQDLIPAVWGVLCPTTVG